MKKIIDLFQKYQHKWNVYKTRFIYKKIDDKFIPQKTKELRLFVIARNESLRLPYFLNYYAGKEVDRIFIIDNNSTDNTRELALSYPNTHVFTINKSYKYHWYWIEFFLNKYGKNYWCMVVDMDELFYFPNAENMSFKDLTEYLTLFNFTSVHSVLLDMYSDKPIRNTKYNPNDNPLDCCPYFDPPHYNNYTVPLFDKKKWKFFYTKIYIGGMRKRVFKSAKNFNPLISKIPLFYYTSNTYLYQGMHGINGTKPADIEGVVFHTKFMHDFIDNVMEESIREEHWDNAAEYKTYKEHILNNSNLTLNYPSSLKYCGSTQLVELGIMQSSYQFENYCKRKHILKKIRK